MYIHVHVCLKFVLNFLFLQVKDKMLYAATKATIKKSFSSGIIIDDVNATTKVSKTTDGNNLC